jgi:hypothetical protein
MKESREIAAAIDQRVRQLAVQRLSDSALVDHMVGYMADLQRLWNATTDDELAALCEDYPGFVRYASLMENMSEVMRSGAGVPAHIRQLAPLSEPLKGTVARLMSEGAALERALQQSADDSRAARFRFKTTPPRESADLDARTLQWRAGIEQLMADMGKSGVPDLGQQLMRQAFADMTRRIEQLRGLV